MLRRRSGFWKLAVGWAVLLAMPIAAQAQFISDVAEFGSGLDGVPPAWTGQVFDHEVEGIDFTVPFLDEDVPFFVDRSHEYNGSTAENTIASLGMTGAEILMVANDNKGVTDYELEIQLSQAVDAYIFVDTRITEPPVWLEDEDWVFTGHLMGIDENGDGVGPGQEIQNRFWIWKKETVGPGTLSTYESNAGGFNQYGLAFMEPGVGPGVREFPNQDYTPGDFGLIDIGADDGRGEPGAVMDTTGLTQIGEAPAGTNDIELSTRRLVSNTGSQFSLTIDNIDETGEFVGALDWRDRGDSFLADRLNLPLVQLGEDLVKNNAGVIRVTLEDLPAGTYEVTSFHLDPDFNQSEQINISVDTGSGQGFVDTGVIGSANVIAGGVGGLTPEVVLSTGATFSFTADGTNDVMILFDGRLALDTEVPLSGLDIRTASAFEPGDFNRNGVLDIDDINQLTAAVAAGGSDLAFDVSGDGQVNSADINTWAKDLANTWIGDVNLDGEFNSGDFVEVFQKGKYEQDVDAVWSDGDWTGDGRFNSGDFVAAFTDGGYETGPRPAGAVSAVPEPTGVLFWGAGLLGLLLARRRR